ncbi:MAG: hypothetical protein RLY71_4625, partial [Pseudomonadota bacterium]
MTPHRVTAGLAGGQTGSLGLLDQRGQRSQPG